MFSVDAPLKKKSKKHKKSRREKSDDDEDDTADVIVPATPLEFHPRDGNREPASYPIILESPPRSPMDFYSPSPLGTEDHQYIQSLLQPSPSPTNSIHNDTTLDVDIAHVDTTQTATAHIDTAYVDITHVDSTHLNTTHVDSTNQHDQKETDSVQDSLSCSMGIQHFVGYTQSQVQ